MPPKGWKKAAAVGSQPDLDKIAKTAAVSSNPASTFSSSSSAPSLSPSPSASQLLLESDYAAVASALRALSRSVASFQSAADRLTAASADAATLAEVMRRVGNEHL